MIHAFMLCLKCGKATEKFSRIEGYIMPDEAYKCWHCGKEIVLSFEPSDRLFCEGCLPKFYEERRKLIKDYAALKIRVMHEQALKYMEKAGLFMYEYYNAADKVFNMAIENTESFLSSHEIVAAIILNEFNYDFKANHKVGRYSIDLFIPELKVCLEIDGDHHKHKLEYDNNRDIEIRQQLGAEWEVVRINTKFIQDTPDKLLDEIDYIYKRKQKLRKNNRGIIPEYFSERERAHYKSILGERVIGRARKL